MPSIPRDLTPFLEAGISVLVGSRDGRLLPEVARVFGARVEASGRELTFFVPIATAERTLANARDNGRLAVCFTAVDHRSYQIKGKWTGVRDADADDRRWIERYRTALAQHFGEVGMAPRLTLRIRHWPAYAFRIEVESIFNQTPGPGAGVPLGKPRRGKSA